MTDKDGVSYKEHFEVIKKRTGVAPEELIPPCEFPSLLSHIWAAFLRLNRSRRGGFSGPEPLSYTEIKNYMETTKRRLEPWQVDTLIDLDTIYLEVVQNG